MSGEDIRRLAHSAGADLQAEVGHALIALRAVNAEDSGTRVEEVLGAVDGILAAAPPMAA